MDFIKDEQQCVNAVSEILNNYGSGKKIAEIIDEFIFDYLGKFMEVKECGCQHVGNAIYAMKEIRDLFFNLETA